MRGVRAAARAVSWLPVAVAAQQAGAQLFWVSGRSMQPSLNPDESLGRRDLLVVQKYGLRAPDSFCKGDVVVLHSPLEPGKVVVKRVVALAGDVARPRAEYPKREVKIPVNHLWVEGDSIHSVDSNTFGPVSMGLIVGKARFVAWPPSRWGAVPPRAFD